MQSLRAHVHIERASSVYETEPLCRGDQPRFPNMAIKGHTALSPDDLLGFLKRIEQRMGRQPTVRYGPLPIHPDILFSDVTGGCLDFGSKAPPGAERMMGKAGGTAGQRQRGADSAVRTW